MVEIVGLHGHSPGTQADHVAKDAHKGGIHAAPQGEARQAAADDEPADDSLKQGVCQADGQHQQHLPEGELGQRGRDLGPVAAEDENHYTGQRQQHQQRKDRLFAGGLLGGVGLFHGTRLLSRYCLQYNTAEPCFCELKQNFSRHFVGYDKKEPLRLTSFARFGLRLPASTSCWKQHLCLAGRGPNSNALYPPLAAAAAVAPSRRGGIAKQ